MLEVLLQEYEASFGEPFPLAKFEGAAEIDVISIVYTCIYEGHPYVPGMRVKKDLFPDAPKS